MLPHTLGVDDVKELSAALSGRYVNELSGGTRIICAPLPADAVCALSRVDGALWVFVDLDKPDALGHARAMLRESAGLDVAEPDAAPTPWGLHAL